MRLSRAALAAPLAVAFVVVLAPAASAQAPPLPDTSTILDDVGATAGDTVGSVTATASGTVEDTTSSLPSEVTDTVDTVTDTIEDPATGIVEGPVRDVADSIDGSVSGGGAIVPDQVLGGTTGTESGLDGSSDWSQSGTGSTDGYDSAASPRAVANRTRAIRFMDGGTVEYTSVTDGRAVITQPDGSFFRNAADIALQGLARAAFPLLLAALVALFLALHGRVGRTDPKLALAPVDPRQRTLTFR